MTDVTATPDPTIPYAYDVAVMFNGGAIIQGGFYLFTIRDSSNGNSSVQDLAENHLDGEFYGSFPSGNGINGSDFVAEIQGYHNKIFAPRRSSEPPSPAMAAMAAHRWRRCTAESSCRSSRVAAARFSRPPPARPMAAIRPPPGTRPKTRAKSSSKPSNRRSLRRATP